MIKRILFDECISQNKLFETGVADLAMARELFNLAQHRELFWKSISTKSTQFPTLFLEGYYEIIKELCTEILAAEGWKALNHECLFTYLKATKNDLEINFDYLLELKDTRNAIDYRGAMASPLLWKQNELQIMLIIKCLKEYLHSKI